MHIFGSEGNEVEGVHLREAIERGIPFARKHDHLGKKLNGLFLPAYIGGVIVVLALALFTTMTMVKEGEFSNVEAITSFAMFGSGAFISSFLLTIIPIVRDILAGVGRPFLFKRNRKLEQEMKYIRMQFENQTKLAAYFCNSYTLERFYHYVETGVATSLKECEMILQQENLRDEIKSLKNEVAELRYDVDRDLDRVRRETRH